MWKVDTTICVNMPTGTPQQTRDSQHLPAFGTLQTQHSLHAADIIVGAECVINEFSFVERDVQKLVKQNDAEAWG
jgi:hypothetical protein